MSGRGGVSGGGFDNNRAGRGGGEAGLGGCDVVDCVGGDTARVENDIGYGRAVEEVFDIQVVADAVDGGCAKVSVAIADLDHGGVVGGVVEAEFCVTDFGRFDGVPWLG